MLMLTLRFDVDKQYDAIHSSFRFMSVEIRYFKANSPPDHVEYVLGPFRDKSVVERVVQDWKAQGFNFHWKASTYIEALKEPK